MDEHHDRTSTTPQQRCAEPPYGGRALLDLQATASREKTQQILAQNIDQLNRIQSDISEGMRSAQEWRRTAHDLKSISGQLGFDAVHGLCASFPELADTQIGKCFGGPLFHLIAASVHTALAVTIRNAAVESLRAA